MKKEKIDILFVNPLPKNASGINVTIAPPLGLAYIAATCENEGFSCKIIDANAERLDNDSVFKEILSNIPDFVGISLNIVTAPSGVLLSRMIKNAGLGCKIILGGPVPTSRPNILLMKSLADAVVIGEGELAVIEILKNKRESNDPFIGVSGIAYSKNNEIVTNALRPRMENINILPIPAYHLFRAFYNYNTRARRKPVGSIITSRGCPFQCIYCNNDVFTGRTTMISADRVVETIDLLVKKYGVRQIDILDDNFTASKDRASEIFDKIIERNYGLAINFLNGLRTENIDSNLISKMKKAGVFKVSIGIESGDEGIQKIIKKGLNLNKALDVCRQFKKAKILVGAFFILGLPGDNRESMQKTIDFAKKMDPDIISVSIAMPFPGTKLFNMIRDNGRFLVNTEEEDIFSGFYDKRVFFEFQETKEEIVLEFFDKIYRDFYFRPKKIFDVFKNVKSFWELRWMLGAAFSILREKRKKSVQLKDA